MVYINFITQGEYIGEATTSTEGNQVSMFTVSLIKDFLDNVIHF